MRELGYSESGGLVFDHRPSTGSSELLSSIAVDIVRQRADVIVVGGSESLQAARQATSSVPIVMTLVADPVELGFVSSFARPGGDITGLSNMHTELAGKWVELLREADPRISRIGVLWNPFHPGHRNLIAGLDPLAAASRVQALPLAVEGAEQIEAAIAAAARERATGLIVLGSTLHIQNLRQIADAALQAKVAALAWTASFAEAGGLITYGASETAQFRRAAAYVDKILKGTSPADLPVEQPTRFEMAVNLRTARSLGLVLPPAILARADQVIE
ncbi:MAG TPA: ABC transporter substrate-binding protein [Vineibacter sp.]|nr:ABC transporter substrate-binding protein [Vineibacter sp.]